MVNRIGTDYLREVYTRLSDLEWHYSNMLFLRDLASERLKKELKIECERLEKEIRRREESDKINYI
jgi:hypothetical protein